jgi:hypothetical protein
MEVDVELVVDVDLDVDHAPDDLYRRGICRAGWPMGEEVGERSPLFAGTERQ